MNDIAIKVENVSKIYKLYDRPIDRLKETLSPSKKKYHKDHYALDNISFKVKKGETVGIIGTNGSGKSTLLKMITGVLTPTSGNITVNGKVSALLELGAGFNPEYTGIENIYLNGTMMGYSREEMDKKVKPILEFADIGEFINQPVKTYSSGMFARLAFAVAINVEPDILIVDEALSVGDVFFQNKCFKKFDRLKNEGTTILFVSHDIGSIKQMCSKVLWIEQGIQQMYEDNITVCNNYYNFQRQKQNKDNDEFNINLSEENINVKPIDEKSKHIYPKINVINESILSQDAEILSLFIQNSDNEIVSEVNTDEEYKFNIIVKFNREVENPIVGFVVENNKGLSVIACNTFLSTKKTFKVDTNNFMKIVFIVKIPRLTKGEYLISPAIASGNQISHNMLTWLHNTTKMSVNNNGFNISLLEIENELELYSIDRDHIRFQ